MKMSTGYLLYKKHKRFLNFMLKTNSIILVDNNDNEIGSCDKLKAHELGLLHRAFSIFIFRKTNNQLQLLIQQRHHKKYHIGGLWTNTCCSHPFPGEKTKNAASRRLVEEMGIRTELKYAGKFRYIAKLSNDLIENECDHVYIGFFNKNKIDFNKNEISNIAWVPIEILVKETIKAPEKYTPWFSEALSIATTSLN